MGEPVCTLHVMSLLCLPCTAVLGAHAAAGADLFRRKGKKTSDYRAGGPRLSQRGGPFPGRGKRGGVIHKIW